jgi:hypothetical protein
MVSMIFPCGRAELRVGDAALQSWRLCGCCTAEATIGVIPMALGEGAGGDPRWMVTVRKTLKVTAARTKE